MYNLHAKNLWFKEHSVQWPPPQSWQRTFPLPQQICSDNFVESSHPSPWSLTTSDLLSITMVLSFLEFHIINIIQYEDFCTWLFSFLSMMLYVHIAYSFLLLNTISLYVYTMIYLSIHRWWTLGLSPIWAYCEYLHTSLCEDMFSFLFD